MQQLSILANSNLIQVDKQKEPKESVHVGWVQPGTKMGRMAQSKGPGEYESLCKKSLTSEGLVEEPYKGKPFVRFREGRMSSNAWHAHN